MSKEKEFASLKQTLEIGRLVEEHCSVVDGYARWHPEWSDNRVAEEVGLTSTSRVSQVRKELKGQLRTSSNASEKTADLLARIQILEITIATHATILEGILNSRSQA